MPDPTGGGCPPIRSIAVISSNAASLANFRGPLLRAMAATGRTVYALAPDFDARTRDAVQAWGANPEPISMDRTGMRPAHDLRDLGRLAMVLRRLKPDATLGYFIKPVIYGSIAARLAGVPRRFALIPGMGYAFTPAAGRETMRRKALRFAASTLYRAGLAACEQVFLYNPEDVEQLVSAGIVSRAKTTLLPGTGVDLDRFAVAAPVFAPRFLLIARLLKEKGVAEYAQAAHIIRQDHPSAVFDLVGGADPNPGAISPADVARWTAENGIKWHGQVDDVRPWIAKASVYVLPSYREGKPRSTQEAMAMARPIVTTDAVGCRDTVIEGENGFKVPVGDAPALARAMRRFIDDPSLIAQMGAASRRIAEARFDVNRINADLLTAMDMDGPA